MARWPWQTGGAVTLAAETAQTVIFGQEANHLIVAADVGRIYVSISSACSTSNCYVMPAGEVMTIAEHGQGIWGFSVVSTTTGDVRYAAWAF